MTEDAELRLEAMRFAVQLEMCQLANEPLVKQAAEIYDFLSELAHPRKEESKKAQIEALRNFPHVGLGNDR